MEREKIKQELVDLLCNRFCVCESDLAEGINPNICTDLGLDSLDVVELAVFFEDKYHLSIPDGEAGKIGEMNFNELVDFLSDAVVKYRVS